MDRPADFETQGWTRFPVDPAVLDWVAHAYDPACAAVGAPDMQHWLQCQATWFVGVDALPNDPTGAIGSSGPLTGQAARFIQDRFGALGDLHPAQVSVIYPGYPRARDGESDAALRYRRNRDGAHVDGLLAVGAQRHRMVQEPHHYILGLPLNDVPDSAAPLVVWEGSHHIMGRAFRSALRNQPQHDLSQVDVTQAYQAARRVVFETCRRVPVPAKPGEAYVLDRMMLHGVAPWDHGVTIDTVHSETGRMIAYFRPPMPGGVADWLQAD